MIEQTLELHEIKKIHDYPSISSKKNDTTLPKIKSIIAQMQKSKHPVCKIIVGVEINKNDPPTGKQLDFLKLLGHTGISPRTKAEASKLIDKLKNNSHEPQDPEKYCTCDKPIPNAITQGRTCQTCKKLLDNSS